MVVWRISKEKYALDKLGIGSQKSGGRWNSPTVPVIYAGMTVEICAFEKLVHTAQILPDDLVLVSIEVPDEPGLYIKLEPGQLPEGWNAIPSSADTVKIGDDFVFSGKFLGLIVPSAVVPEAYNIVLNPMHPRYQDEVRFTIVRPFVFDQRLRPAPEEVEGGPSEQS